MAKPMATATILEPGLSRVDAPSIAFGFTKPPCQVDLRFVHASNGWTIVVSCEPAQLDACQRWLHGLGAADVTRTTIRGPVLLRARFNSLPTTCAAVLDLAHTDHVVVASDGIASILVRGPGGEADRVAHCLDGVAVPGIETPLLTERQDELLRYCVERGYYSIPRGISLGTLAQPLGISTTSLSLALRRAEAKIVLSYISRIPALAGKKDLAPAPAAPPRPLAQLRTSRPPPKHT